MNLIRSKKGFFAIGALVAVFCIFAGVAFVQSQEAKTEASVATAATIGTVSSCPVDKESGSVQNAGMPGSCAELHGQALAAGRMTQPAFDAATAVLVSTNSDSKGLTAEQCKELMAKLGYECNETDLKVCAEKLKALGLCGDMTAEQCADQMAKGACCPTSATSAHAGGVEVTTAVATQPVQAGKAKQCDWTKGNCGPADETGSTN